MGQRKEAPRPARVVGYLIAVAVNAALLWAAWNVLDWDVLPFLTPAWRDVLPALTLSFGATIAVNAGYVVYDPPWLRSVAGIVVLAISVAVTVRLFQVFPLDFSAYGGPWERLARVLLVLAAAGAVIGIVVELVRLVRLACRLDEPPVAAVPPVPPTAGSPEPPAG